MASYKKKERPNYDIEAMLEPLQELAKIDPGASRELRQLIHNETLDCILCEMDDDEYEM